MKVIKTWATVIFTHGNSNIELTLNYKNKSYKLEHGSNDGNVVFSDVADAGKIQNSIDRNKCVTEALKYVCKELNIIL